MLLAAAALLVAPAAAAEAGATLSAVVRVGTIGCPAGPTTCPLRDFQDTAVLAPWIEAGDDARFAARGAVDLRLHGPTALASLDDADDPPAVGCYSPGTPDPAGAGEPCDCAACCQPGLAGPFLGFFTVIVA